MQTHALRCKFELYNHLVLIIFVHFTGNMIKKLLILESVRGPLPGYIPAVKEVAEYLNAVSTSNAPIEMLTLHVKSVLTIFTTWG